MKNEHFNLTFDPWLPVLQGGKVRLAGIEEVLAKAHEIDRLEINSPLAEAAVTRLLLSILHRALGGPKDEDEALDLFRRGKFPTEKIEKYLDRYRKRFYLFHPSNPFFQVPDLDRGGSLPWTKLLPERASGNNATLFDHSLDDEPPLATYGEAAMALLVHQSFVPGGLLRRMGVGSARGGPLAAAAIFLPQGRNLFETLVLNLVPYDPRADEPIWEAKQLNAKAVEAYKTKWPQSGRTRVYTWPARAVLLIDDGDGVRRMAYGPGVDPQPAMHVDPMLAYASSENGTPLPVRLRLDRAFWRDLETILPKPTSVGSVPLVLQHARGIFKEIHGRRKSLPLRIVGQIPDQAKILDARREVYPFPMDALDPKTAEMVRLAVARAEDVGQKLMETGRTMAREFFGTNESSALSKFVESLPLMRHYWSRLDVAFPTFLENFASNGAAALDDWKREVEYIAREAWDLSKQAVGLLGRHLRAIQQAEIRFGAVIWEARR